MKSSNGLGDYNPDLESPMHLESATSKHGNRIMDNDITTNRIAPAAVASSAAAVVTQRASRSRPSCCYTPGRRSRHNAV